MPGASVPTNTKPRNAFDRGSGPESHQFSLPTATTAQTDKNGDTKRNSWAFATKTDTRNAVRMLTVQSQAAVAKRKANVRKLLKTKDVPHPASQGSVQFRVPLTRLPWHKTCC